MIERVDYFGAAHPSPHDDIEQAKQVAVIMEFLENEELTIISAVLDKNAGRIKFEHEIPNDEVSLLFYKIPQVGAEQNQQKIQRKEYQQTTTLSAAGTATTLPPLGILTLEGGLVKSIYNSVARVFTPHAEARKTEYTAELSGLLENLHVSLGSTLGVPQSGITSVKDEIKYWRQRLLQKSSSRLEREAAQTYIGVLERIDQQIGIISDNNSKAETSIEDFLDQAHNLLDELWRLPFNYPQNRMADLLDVIGNLLLHSCLQQLLAEDIWNVHAYQVNSLMSQCIDTVDAWMQLCDSLTRLFWPNYVKHPWLGEPHMPKRGQQFKARLAEIRNLRSLYKQILTLLDDAELQHMFQENSPFQEINIFDTSSLGQSKWQKALQHFEFLLQPIDERIAAALKAQLHHHLSNPRQVIHIFSKYETLIQRPTVLDLLTIEREQFLQSLQILLQDLRKAMNDTNMEPDTGHLSVICNECRWLKVVQYQIIEIEKVSHLISGREGFEKINKAVLEIKEETESLLRTNFEIWCGQCASAVKSGELRLRDDQAVVQFEKEGRQLMRVTFNPKLVTFCQDVREFENLGYTVPLELRSAATHAAKYMSYARRLQQIATFHNTIGDRMIPCQRPIMLKNAMELSKLVQSETVAWNDEDSVQRYVDMLQSAVAKLSADNTLLVGYHEQAKRTVIKLMNTDLFTQNQAWKDEMRHLRELVATLERQGFTNLNAFKLHWDHQLYKVLEYQYLLGLLDMNNKLPDIHIKISFRNRQLIYTPPEEEIREKYFSQLKRFIERPCNFRGLSDNSSELFKTMVEINRQHFGPLFQRAEELFAKLESFKQIWLPWVALGCIDIEELCSVHLNISDDWDRNFRACKNFSQKIAKLQNSEESIDCIIINILPLRSDIEYISRRYWEALTNSLRASILNDVTLIQEYLQNSLQFLQNVPMDEASITESGMKYEKIMSELPKISETLTLVKAKDTCLAGWCKERVTALAGILHQWEKLQPLLENHAVILQRQVDMIKAQAHSQIQNLHNEAEKFLLRWEATIAELEANEHSTLDVYKERKAHWQQIQSKKEQLLEECRKFNMEFPEEVLAPFQEVEEKMSAQSEQWEVYDKFLTELKTLHNEEWAIYRRRPYMLTEFIANWEGSLHSSLDLPSKRIRLQVEQLQSLTPVLQQLQSDALVERHWARIFLLLKKSESKPMHAILLGDILSDMQSLQQLAPEIAQIVRQAASEQIVRQALTELDQWSVTANLKLTTHKDSAGQSISLIKDFQDVLNKIGDNQSLLQAAKNSAAFESFSDQASLWETRLNSIDSILTSLSQAQRRWVYLEPVFGAGTLSNEEALFKRIDKDFRFVMREIQSDPRVISLTKINNITTIVNSLETQLTRCQNNLMSYIMEKRDSFPRFYFLGDDDLLEILGQASKDAEIIQKHIKKLFPGCHSLGIKKSSVGDRVLLSIESVHSAEGDVLKLKRAVDMTGAIEIWLNELVNTIRTTLQQQIYECTQTTFPNSGSSANNFNANDVFNLEVLNKYVIQVLSTTRAIHFTKQTEKAIMSMSLAKLQQNLNLEITNYAKLKNQPTTDALLRIKLRALLFDLVHYVTVVQQLQQQNCMSTNDWHWLSQLKFYLPDSSSSMSHSKSQQEHMQVHVRMVYAEFEYSYEFLGNPNKLVSTTLTHKCYLILTQAMKMGLGGNPFGPAGTGKTECVKALGALLGRLVLVFNCDENVDTESMHLILTGLARCGAWGCFDEFNRLQETTLSAISMLIQPIQMALKEQASTVQMGEKAIKLNHHCGIFVTLNPAGIEYGGRQKLPGNIQALFRPIVMQQPEPREIARVMLFVEGYQQADEIAERIVELFDLCNKMLSAQRHYDWGLRELKTILLACGEGLRTQSTSKNDSLAQDEEQKTEERQQHEMSIVVQCLRLATMSKLAAHDVQRFDMLLQNVFPEIPLTLPHKSALQQSLTEAFAALSLCFNEQQIAKALQLQQQLIKRMGVVIVGPAGCGKSTVIALLRHALASQQGNANTIRVHTISPKSMNRVQLLGHLDPDTRQWCDGVLTHTAVMVNAEPRNVHSWIICDGSIDPEWIEALNSVLDDNKLLTLPSGWRIQFGDNVNFIFETDDVKNASPATISRMGIVNMSNDDLPLEQIMQQQIQKAEFPDLLQSYMEELYEPAIEWLERNYLHSLPSLGRTNLMRSLQFQLQIHDGLQTREEFCYALCKSLLGYLPNDRHNELANMIYEKANIYISNPQMAHCVYYQPERAAIMHYESDDGSYNGQMLIQTAAIKSYLDVVNGLLGVMSGNLPTFMLIGPTGAAKTLLLQQTVQEHAGYELVIINCSQQLTPAYVLHTLKQNCMTVTGLRGREYRPRQTRIVLLFKNLDLCFVDAWGASEIVELLLQLIQRNGFYASNLEWISISGIQICATLSSAAQGTLLKIAPRYLAINQFVRVSYPSAADMLNIVQRRLESLLEEGHGQQFKLNNGNINVPYIAEGLMEFFTKLQSTFNGTQRFAHYQFSPKFIMKLIENLKHYPAQAFNEAFYCELVCIFRDPLATLEDLEKFDGIVKASLRKFLGKEKIYFIPTTPKHNSELAFVQHDDWMDEVQKQITICATENYVIDEPVTEELLEQTAKISRLLARHSTHLLLLGQPGGRQIDALYIAATRQQVKVIGLQGNSAGYTLADFYNELKMAMQIAAVENQCTCLLIEHCWLSYLPDLMKPIEAILEGSEILDLFGDDLESVASSLKHAAQLEGYQESLSSYFMKRVKQNLHLIISLDSSSLRVNEYFNKYPALYRNVEFLYVQAPKKETLAMLPKKFIETLNDTRSLGQQNNAKKVPVTSYFADAIEDNLIAQQAPKRYYQLIRSYYHIYSKNAQDIDKRLEKLQQGVDKLAAAHAVVDSLKSNAVQQEEAVAEKRRLANDALEMISATMRNANDQKTTMLELKQQAQVSSKKLKERQKEIEQELSEVEPILNEAKAAVGQIKSEALSEIRSLRAPPEAVRDILEGVLRLMGIRDTSWNSMKTFLAKRGVKEDIRLLDPARINPENCEAVERLLANKADSFEMKNAKRASAAAAPLAAWVKACVRFSRVIQSIQPLELEQKQLQQNLDAAEGELESLKTGLDDVDNRVKQLSAKLNNYTQEAAVLELKLQEARSTLDAAEVLVEKLSSEYGTWSKQLDEYRGSYKTLDTKALLIALALNYFSHLTLERRISRIESLAADLQLKRDFALRNHLLTEQEQIIWESMGLARDAQIIENAAILRQMLELPFASYPIPLILDPTQTAINWLTEYLQSKSKAYELTTQHNERLPYTLELAVRFGKILIVQDCQELRPPLMQLISMHTYVKFNKRQVAVASKMVDLHEDFQLVLVTNTDKLSMGEELGNHISCIPFTVTTVGLTDQLMSKAIVLKNPQLEDKRIELLKQEGVLLKQRIDLEDKLLEELSSSQGDILKNTKLLATLNEVKESSSFTDKSLKESALVKATLLDEFTELQQLCAKAANFYIQLTATHELSVVIFIKLFLRALESFEVKSTSQHDEKIYAELVRSVFQYLAGSTPRSSHLSLALQLAKTAYPERITSIEWELFVTNFMSSNDASIGSATLSKMKLPEGISKEAALKLHILLSQIPQLAAQLQFERDYAWRSFLNSQTDEMPAEIPAPFQRVLLVQILRPDLITQQLRQTAAQCLGISPDAIAQPTIEQLVEESNKERPIMLITQTECDPATEIKSVALKRLGSAEKYQEISIGNGIERKALEAIRNSAETGKWICLKNVHLVPEWLVTLERELGNIKKHEAFRLWLVCESTKGFSEAVMYKFSKVLYEFPNSIKQKVKRMLHNYAAIEQRAATPKEPKLLKMRIVLFIATAVLQERRKFIPQGWSQYYEFGDADLKATLEIANWLDSMTSSGRCDWQIMQRLCENVAYGGRINNSQDLAVLQKYLLDFCNADVLSTRWTPLNWGVSVSTSLQMQDYQNAIAKFPDVDEPETFKLSKHSNISRELEFSKSIIRELRTAYYKKSKEETIATIEEEQKWEKQIKPILALWRKLAGKVNVQQSLEESEAVEIPNKPWALFVISELKIAAKCSQEVHNTLTQAYSMLKDGQSCQSESAEGKLMQTLAENQVPLSWLKLWAGPRSAVEYIRALITRSQAAEERFRSQLHVEFAESIDLIYVFNCETLLACLKLVNSLKLGVSCKNLQLQSKASADDSQLSASQGSTVALTLAPLKLDGAVFANGKLVVSKTTEATTSSNRTPEILISFNKRSEDARSSRSAGSAHSNGYTSLPLYTNGRRERLLCQLQVPTSESADTILLSGAALLVNED